MNKSPTERAEKLIAGWEQRLRPKQVDVHQTRMPAPSAAQGQVERADALLDRVRLRVSGQGIVQATARVYVGLAAKTQEVVDPVRQNWQKSVEQARREQEQQAARAGGPSAAKRKEAEEKRGEQTLKKTGGDASEAADVAGEAAGAA